MNKLLKEFIIQVLFEETKDKEVLGEPDLSSEDEREEDEDSYDEQNIAANLGGGPATPLGTGPSGSRKQKVSSIKKARKKVIDTAKRNFGGAE